MDETDHQILALLTDDGRRTYDDVARRVSLSAPAVKRRIDRLRADGTLRGFTAVIDHAGLGYATEALVELFYGPAIQLDEVAASLRARPEVVEAWSVTGEADAIAGGGAREKKQTEQLII
jgi:Lrp/AsnC family transcriptional regulator, leucine-responsive regulatory protein